MGTKHWDHLPWEGALGHDDSLKLLTTEMLLADSQRVLDDLDDLCVLLLFSVFEAIIRSHVLAEVEVELATLKHVAIKRAVTEMKETLEHGSFYRVLEPYKGIAPDVVEQVNQVRRYRNWVAHGRRSEQPETVTPSTAYERLTRFLEALNRTTGDGSG